MGRPQKIVQLKELLARRLKAKEKKKSFFALTFEEVFILDVNSCILCIRGVSKKSPSS